MADPPCQTGKYSSKGEMKSSHFSCKSCQMELLSTLLPLCHLQISLCSCLLHSDRLNSKQIPTSPCHRGNPPPRTRTGLLHGILVGLLSACHTVNEMKPGCRLYQCAAGSNEWSWTDLNPNSSSKGTRANEPSQLNAACAANEERSKELYWQAAWTDRKKISEIVATSLQYSVTKADMAAWSLTCNAHESALCLAKEAQVMSSSTAERSYM